MQQVLSRYVNTGAFSREMTFKELAQEGINTSFILSLKRVFEDDKNFNPSLFNLYSLDIITDYIRRTHKYYLNKKLLEIEQSIHLLLQDYNDQHPLLFILHTFYNQYKRDLSEHIVEEENELLPYIAFLQNATTHGFSQHEFYKQTHHFSLRSFLDNHVDPDEDLQRVRLSILRYHPPVTNETPYRILLSQLTVFEKDLAVHALIEEQVLLPRALELENKIATLFHKKIRLT